MSEDVWFLEEERDEIPSWVHRLVTKFDKKMEAIMTTLDDLTAAVSQVEADEQNQVIPLLTEQATLISQLQTAQAGSATDAEIQALTDRLTAVHTQLVAAVAVSTPPVPAPAPAPAPAPPATPDPGTVPAPDPTVPDPGTPAPAPADPTTPAPAPAPDPSPAPGGSTGLPGATGGSTAPAAQNGPPQAPPGVTGL